jgi:hypothetical protein
VNRDAERLAALLDDWADGRGTAPDTSELADLLATARAVHALEGVPPPGEGLNRGRAAFIAAGVRQAEGQRARGRALGLGGLLARYRLAPVALAMTVLMLGGVVTTARAQVSLPGDVLYPVKRLTETVQVAFVRGVQRQSLEAELQQRRRVEAQQLLTRRRAEAVRFEGRVTQLADGRMTVDGLLVVLDGLGGLDLAPGALVQVDGATGPDGVVHARLVRLVAPADGPPAAVVAVPAATRDPRLQEPEPTSTSRPPSPTPVPVVITRVPTAAPTEVPQPTAAPTQVADAPRVRERQIVEWEGALERVGPELWAVAGVEFYRPTGRVIGDALVCSRVHVKAERKHDRLELVELRVLSPAAKPEIVAIKGTLEAMGSDEWVIDGQHVIVTSSTEIVGTPAVGRGVRATVLVDACGRRVVQRIEVDASLVEFVGVLQSFNDTLWVVDGRSIQLIPGRTVVKGTPWVGALVSVRAEQADDGGLVARELMVRDGPPTPTVSPTWTPTATPGTMAPAPSETPTAEPTVIGPVVP